MEEDHSFTPGNDRLVDGYLRAKIDGKIGDLANACFFHDADVCSARPHELVHGHMPARVPCRDAGDGQQWFFFSPARFVGKSQTRRSRTIDGTDDKESWHAEGCPKPVEGSAGGYLQKFSYHVRTARGIVEKPGWIMAEYSFKNTGAGDLVLCKIYKSPRGPGRSKTSSSSSASSAKSGCKRKATDDGEHLEAPTPSTRQADEDDIMQFAVNIERDLLSDDDQMAALELGETRNVAENQLAPATVDSMTPLQKIATLLMKDEEDDGTTLRAPDGDDPVEYYMSFFNYNQEQLTIDELLIDDHQQDASAIRKVYDPLTDYDVIAALATGITVDDLILDCPFPHQR